MMSRSKSKISPLEWELMGVIWALGGKPCVRDVLEKAYPGGDKAYTTVQTVMNTLVRKGFLSKEKIGLVNFYKPLKSRNEVVLRETDRFVNRVFNGSIQTLARYLIQLDALTEEEIADLKKLVEAKEHELKGDRS